MSPEKAKIFWVEDRDNERRLAAPDLEKAGHIIVGNARTFQEAMDSIPGLANLGTQVVILDGNLTEGETGGYEGHDIGAAIKQAHPDIIVVGNSSYDDIRTADINCPKFKGPEALAKTITEV